MVQWAKSLQRDSMTHYVSWNLVNYCIAVQKQVAQLLLTNPRDAQNHDKPQILKQPRDHNHAPFVGDVILLLELI